MNKNIIIIGAGPAGLACATELAHQNQRVTLIERKIEIGGKVCAGGITCNGQLQELPSHLIQKTFYSQKIKSPLQNITLSSKSAMLATVNRVELGQYMLKQATDAGVEVLTNSQVVAINSDENSIQIKNIATNTFSSLPYSHLIGADGATSIVRRHLGLSTEDFGIGINYQVPIQHDHMEWHFTPKYFKNGYGWIFPHRSTISIGAYVDSKNMTGVALKENCIKWALKLGFDLTPYKPRAEKISYDYKGWEFGNIFLAGEAAGITSALTGEGINAAILTGKHVANYIVDNDTEMGSFTRLIEKHDLHKKLVHNTTNAPIVSRVVPEIVLAMLRFKLISFNKLELTS